MIESFRHKGLKRLFINGETKGLTAAHIDRIENILGLLDAAATPQDMNLPSFRLHQLTGNLKGLWAITVRANWRVVFRFEGGNAHDVDLIDDH